VSLHIPVSFHHSSHSIEQIDGQDMVITRKGAISTRDSDLALIPGSMGVGSYLVRGLANPDSFYSAAHGAGRTTSRNAARKTFTGKDLQKQTRGAQPRKDTAVPGAA